MGTILHEYAITPDVFDLSSYSSEEVAEARFDLWANVFSEEALIRNLRNGKWFEQFKKNDRKWHARGKTLLQNLNKRMRVAAAELPKDPSTDLEWGYEAFASDKRNLLTGILTTKKMAYEFNKNKEIIRSLKLLDIEENDVIDALKLIIIGDHDSTKAWKNRKQADRLPRSISTYESELKPIMELANSVMFMDHGMDPSDPDYEGFIDILLMAKERIEKPLLIELHRLWTIGAGHKIVDDYKNFWEKKFNNIWGKILMDNDMQVKVYLWNDLHDRYIISDVFAYHIGNELKTHGRDTMTWSRVPPDIRDTVMREMANPKKYKLMHDFSIPLVKEKRMF